MKRLDRRFEIPGSEWLLALLCVVLVSAVVVWTDLSPKVESDFFFSPTDPQLEAAQEMRRRFPSPEQVVIRVASSDMGSAAYRASIRELTAALDSVAGVSAVNSIATDDARRSPVWGRMLLTPDSTATNIIVSAHDPDPAELIPRLEAAWQPFETAEISIAVSGVPYVVELIRRNLLRDLVLFSSAALLIFGALVSAVYRDWRIVLGTVSTCLMACAATLGITHLFDIKVGLLTANIAVIVFVLTLSHIVFLVSNWRRCKEDAGEEGRYPVAAAVGITFQASFWCMLTTLLGFLSLLIASAQPLRELGLAGAIGTLTAITVTYGVFPTFLRRAGAAEAPAVDSSPMTGVFGRLGSFLPRRGGRRWLAAIGGVVLIAAIGLPRLNTDPSLLSYFAVGSELRDGLETIDRDGGSSSLDIAVADPNGMLLDTDEVNRKMWTLQEALEDDPSVGRVISPAVLLAHVKQQPFMGQLDWTQLLGVLDRPPFAETSRAFITPERDQGKFFVLMREAGRTEERQQAIARIRRHVEESGLEVRLIGGSYELQGQLGELIAESIRIGLGGLLILFVGIAFIVSRTVPRTVAILACLGSIPLIVLGGMSHLGMPIDIITSPAANVAVAMGVDSMTHLVFRVRRLWSVSATAWEAWMEARTQLWQPVLGATLIICAGFGIFSLSAFPPTQRFGLAVILGTVAAAVMTLIALPFAMTIRPGRPGGLIQTEASS
jgi:predicted RND superfamily exporter protein